jgi:transcriptional regulator with XRE-family HTH domain
MCQGAKSDECNIMQRLGEKLRVLRVRRGFSFRELAAILSVSSYSHLAEIESGKSKPSVELLVKLADLYGVTTDQLLRDHLEVEES